MTETVTQTEKPAGAPRGDTAKPQDDAANKPKRPPALPKEIGGPPGPEPTRYGDWEYKGRCTDF